MSKVYRGHASPESDNYRMPERKRSPRAKAETLARRQARAFKNAEATR